MKFNEKLLKEKYFPQALTKIKEIVKIQSYAQPPQQQHIMGLVLKKY
ncbi:hypothetical protein [Spiroplasma endosymbiont of Apeira syringaria]